MPAGAARHSETGPAAMTVEGNWIIGAMQSTYPKISYQVVPMPAGPRGHHGTLVFTNCWGIAASSKYTAADVSFVKYLASPAQQLKFADAFGVDAIAPERGHAVGRRAHHNRGQWRYGDPERIGFRPG